MSKLGDVIDGKYEILKEVGRGGMSIVYLAMDNRLNKQWAVKEIKKKGSNSANQIVVQSLLAEANLMKRLDHPHLPRIVDIIDDGNTIYIVMDYIEGEPLDKLLKAKGAQEQDAVIEWGKQLAEVLDYLHTREPAIIYRDMKPANVMLRPDGTVKLIDFGIAREYKERNSADTVSLGTKGYAAPEQFGGMGQTDARTDVYCLGVTLYHLVTGKNPTEPPYEILPIRSIDPKLSSGLEAIIAKCTQLNPDDRFQSCAEVLYALNHLNEFDGVYRKKQKRKLNGFIAALASSLVLALAGVGCFLGYRATLSQTVSSYIAQYGSDAPDGGNREELKKVIEDIGDELDEDTLGDVISEFVDVCKNDLQNVIGEYGITGENEFSEEEKEKIDKEETEIFKDLDDIEINYVQEISSPGINGEIYYSIATLYMENYKLSESMFDTKYVSIRYEEAGKRFRKIEAGIEGEDKIYADNVGKIGDIISEFNQSKQGLSGNDADLTEETKTEYWEKIKSCISLEEGSDLDNKQINMHLIVSSILWLERADYSKLSGSDTGKAIIEDIYNSINQSTIILNQFINANSGDTDRESQLAKAKYAVENYKNACQTITGREVQTNE